MESENQYPTYLRTDEAGFSDLEPKSKYVPTINYFSSKIRDALQK